MLSLSNTHPLSCLHSPIMPTAPPARGTDWDGPVLSDPRIQMPPVLWHTSCHETVLGSIPRCSRQSSDGSPSAQACVYICLGRQPRAASSSVHMHLPAATSVASFVAFFSSPDGNPRPCLVCNAGQHCPQPSGPGGCCIRTPFTSPTRLGLPWADTMASPIGDQRHSRTDNAVPTVGSDSTWLWDSWVLCWDCRCGSLWASQSSR